MENLKVTIGDFINRIGTETDFRFEVSVTTHLYVFIQDVPRERHRSNCSLSSENFNPLKGFLCLNAENHNFTEKNVLSFILLLLLLLLYYYYTVQNTNSFKFLLLTLKYISLISILPNLSAIMHLFSGTHFLSM